MDSFIEDEIAEKAFKNYVKTTKELEDDCCAESRATLKKLSDGRMKALVDYEKIISDLQGKCRSGCGPGR